MSDFKLPCNCQWQHSCGPNLLCPVHGSSHHIAATLKETQKKLGTYELRIAELEAVAEAARELAAIKHPVYSGPKSIDVKKGVAVGGELLYYSVLPHLMHKLDKALLGGGG